MNTTLYAQAFTGQHLVHLKQWLADASVHRNLYALYRPMSSGELEGWLARERDGNAQIFFYCTAPETSAATAAGMGLVHYMHPKHACGELSIIVNPACAGKGYGWRILLHLMEYAFNEHGLHKIFFHCAASNSRMITIAEKTGFVREGVYREEMYLDDTWHNTYRFGMLAREYAAFIQQASPAHNILS